MSDKQKNRRISKSASQNNQIIRVNKVSKIYYVGDVETTALDHVSFEIAQGEYVAIMGPSGSGKSTLMHILGALDTPTSGEYVLDNQNVGSLSSDELATIRNHKIGFVFQAYNLLPRTTSLKNVMLPMRYAGIETTKCIKVAKEKLIEVGLENRFEHTTSQLSGGQQQRVAIARALTMNPAIILADEPTGNIATNQADEIMAIFAKLHSQGHTIVMITHESDIAERAGRIIMMRDGKIVSDKIK